ncbi:E3 ubiquitin-protein ligase TRIM39-like [Cololabis saira]|uniref:E3 ubiquitin-protein ligase TRIM39-like n=1 Tax=Cololabis saira TaxID=129043 RepID=UPI002AD4D869|nr:E3 ubiquitin-protein ligase TRIM39-like [Cololabis saira]
MDSAFCKEQFTCAICLECFFNPVSIPCGHNFCRECINHFWDTKTNWYCPLCKDTFQNRPELKVNVGLRDITDHFKNSLSGEPAKKPVPAKRRSARQAPEPDDILCDICDEDKLTAIKSCLVCRGSYCETHLTPHLRDPVMMKHRLTDPAAFVNSHLCTKHNQTLEMFCKRDQTPVCKKCTERGHKHHEVVAMETESKRVKAQMKKTQAEIEQMIEVRIKKTEEIKQSVELSRIDREKQIQTSMEFATMAICVIEKNQTLLIEEIEQKHKAVETRAEELLLELQQEIDKLQQRQSELQHLEETKEPLHLLQSYSHVSAPPSTTNWCKVMTDPDHYVRTVRRTFSRLVDICQELEQKLAAEEVVKMSEYSVDVILDPVTAAGWLVLSPDGKKVSLSSQQRKVPNDPRRFDSCTAVLGKQSFTFGRWYWVVQVGDKTDWDLGVARESINRKGSINVRPDNGYWVICRRKGGSLRACTGPSTTLKISDTPLRVSVFLDHEQGSLSFYNTDTKAHIYTYSGLTFTEPLKPYFNPCLHDNGRNTAPLVICPLEAGLPVEAGTL